MHHPEPPEIAGWALASTMDPPVVATKSEPQAPDHGNAPEEPEDSKEGLQQIIQEMNDPSNPQAKATETQSGTEKGLSTDAFLRILPQFFLDSA